MNLKNMNFNIRVQCTHTEPKLQKNVDCEFIESLFEDLGGVFRCPICQRETVITLQEGAE